MPQIWWRRRGWGLLAHQNISLSYLIRRLLKPLLCRVNTAIAIVDVLLQVAHIVVVEPVTLLFSIRECLVFRFEGL